MTLSLFSLWQGQIASATAQSLTAHHLLSRCRALAHHSMDQGLLLRTCTVTGHSTAMIEYWPRAHEMGHSLHCSSADARKAVTSRVICTKKMAPVIGEVSQPDTPIQRGAMQPNWWQHLSSVAAACALAALLTAGGPCSPAEARARLTQVTTVHCSDTL